MSLVGDGQYYMSWKIINTLEYIGTFLLLSVIISISIYFIDSIDNRWFRTISLVVLVSIPLLFFTIHILRQFLGKGLVVSISEHLFSVNGVIILSILFFILIYMKKLWFNRLYEYIISVVLILFPLSALTVLVLLIYGFNGHTDSIGNLDRLSVESKTTEAKHSIYVFLFDELDYSVLYDEKGEVNKIYSNLHSFSKKSINYHNARSPGKATLQAIPQLLIGKKINNIHECGNRLCSGNEKDKDSELVTTENIFKVAQSKGLTTATIGWMHPYCEQYGDNTDYCRSYGVYNNSSFDHQFSLLNPIYTNIIMLPHQMPFGLLKNPVYSKLHHKNTEHVQDLALKIIEKEESTFSFIHYGIPHIPFVYSDNKYQLSSHPFYENKENYKEQLLYVDYLFGQLVSKIRQTNKLQSSTIMVLSDHGFRKILKKDDHDHVPMLVYYGNNPKYIEVSDEVATEEVLLSLIMESNYLISN